MIVIIVNRERSTTTNYLSNPSNGAGYSVDENPKYIQFVLDYNTFKCSE